MNALVHPPAPIQHAAAIPLLRTLVLCDIVDSTALTQRLGDQRAADLFRKHDRLARALLPLHGGREIDKTDGFLLMFERPVQAVAFALDYQRALRDLNEAEGSTLATRVGIHVGDVVAWDNSPEDIARGAKPIEVEGLVKPITSRLTQLALPNQILLSGVAHALAHRAQGELGERLEAIRWRTHGRYRFKGVPDPIPVFEVGDEGFAPLKAPPWSGKAHREVPFWRRPATLGIEVAALLLMLAIPAWYLLRPAPAIAFANRDWVVVGDLKNLTGDTRFDESIETAFRIGLEQSRYVNVLSNLKTHETVRLMQKDPDKTAIDRAVGSEVALRDGARALILPTVAEIGGRVRVTAEVVDPSTQTTVYSESADGAGATSVLPSLDKVNQQLRVRLGEALATVAKESRPLERVTTRNLDALKAYSLGMSSYASGDFKQAGALLRQAIQLDPDFALAHLNLGNVLSATATEAEAVAEFRKATALTDRLSTRDALYTEASLANFEAPGSALEKWRLLARMYPDFTPATGALAFFSYEIANDFDGAVAAGELNAVSTNPRRSVGDYLLGIVYLGQERYPDAERRFEEARKNGFATTDQYRAYLYAAQRQFDKAERILAGSATAGAENDSSRWYPRIKFAADRGDWTQAREAATKPLHQAPALDGDSRAEYALIDASLQALSAPADVVKSGLSDYLKAHVPAAADGTSASQFRLLFAGYLAAHAGQVEFARTLRSRVGDTTPGKVPFVASLRTVVDAEIARAGGDPKHALELLAPYMDGHEYYFSHWVRAQAYAALGNYAAALADAQWLARHRGRAYVEQFGQATLQPFNVAISDLALLSAAEYAQKLGDAAASRKSEAEFRAAWPNAAQTESLGRRLQALEASRKSVETSPRAENVKPSS